jgi:diguanylate cyclase (GGDEF)-like protein
MFFISRRPPFLLSTLIRIVYSLLAALSMLSHLPALAQLRPGLVSFHRVAIPDGIPAQLTSAMVQDAQGLIWVGTHNGLVCYDGYNFKLYQSKPGDATTLSGNYVRSLYIARDGRLWVGSASNGVSVFDPHTETFKQYRHKVSTSSSEDSLAHNRVEAIVEDQNGRIWLATDGGLDRLDPTTGVFTHFQHDVHNSSSLASNRVRALLIDHANQLWVGTRNGLQRWVSDAAGFVHVVINPQGSDSLVGEDISTLFEGPLRQIWVGTTESGAAVLNPKTGRLHRLRPSLNAASATGLSHYWVYNFAQVNDKEVWISTFGGGVDVVDPTTLKVIDHLHHDSMLTNSLGGDRTTTLLVDRSGLVWVGSWGNGLAWHDPSTRAFLKWRYSLNNPTGPTHPEITQGMETQDGMIWLGTNGNGIDVMDSKGRFRMGFRPNPADPAALADGLVSAMLQATNGTIWVATLEGTLHRLRSGQTDFQRFTSEAGLPGGAIRAMVVGPDGALWVGSVKGLARIDAANDHITAFTYRNDPVALSGREVRALAFGADDTLWVGTENGLNAFDIHTGQFTRILRDPNQADSLPDNWISDLMVANDGKLWVATQSGVAILKRRNGSQAYFDILKSRLNLPAYPTNSLIQDKQGRVWIGSHIYIDPTTWRYRSFGPADGNEFSFLYPTSRASTRRGDLLFGSPEGLLIVRPDQLTDWAYQPPVIISSVRIDNQELVGVNTLKQLALSSVQRNMRLEFAALDFSAPQNLRYRYQLEGYDADWVNVTDEERLAIYTGLPPGNYQLRIQGTNRANVWSPAELRMAVSVAPAFYQTWWCKLATLLFGVIAITALFQLRLRQLRQRSATLERAVAERTADLETAYKHIEVASLTDPLTQLNNRRFLEKTIQSEFELVTRQHSAKAKQPNTDLVLLMLDLDHFKQVNDWYGHAAGDAVLVQTANLLKLCMRASDYVVRWGGEEFLLVARLIDRDQAPGLAEKIRSTINAHAYSLPNGQVIHRTVSIGFAVFPFIAGQPTPMTLDTLQRMADMALYAVKRSCRNAWLGIVSTEKVTTTGEAVIELFLNDPETAIAEGLVKVLVTPDCTDQLRWK